MDEMVKNLTRAHDLAIQAASYNTATDRASLNQEVAQLLDEMSRVVNQTRYNGEKLLAGGFSGDFQVGAFVNETINVAINNLSPTGMGVATNYSTVNNLTDAQLANRIAVSYNNALSSDTVEGSAIADVAASTVSSSKISALNNISSATGITAFAYGNGLVGSTYATNGAAATVTDGITSGALVINGISIGSAASGADYTTVGDALVAAINAKTSEHGVVAVNSNNPNGAGVTNSAIVLINRTGAAITVTTNTTVDSGIAAYFASGTTSVAAGANGAIVLNDDLGDTTSSFNDAGTGAAITGVSAATATLADATVNAQTVTTAGNANLAMLVFEKALDSVNSQRSIMGAKLNRLEAVVRNIENVRENVSQARSRIQDADFAAETAAFTRAQILQQAGTAMVAQANQMPQNVLALLGQ
jgi:flagellin